MIVAMPDRRGTLPMEELLDLRLGGVKVEEATSWLEKISGRIEVEQLYPSWLIFAEGFRFSSFFRLIRRAVNFRVALVGTVLIVAAASVHHVWRSGWIPRARYCTGSSEWDGGGVIFTVTNSAPCEWMPRLIPGQPGPATMILAYAGSESSCASSRLDEIPQLWCVLKGDMHSLVRVRSGRNLSSG